MPPHRCSYFKCENTSALKSMFRFPWKDPDRLKVWLENCGNMTITHLTPEKLKNRYLCLDHFEEKSIKLFNPVDNGRPRRRNRSKRNAIPKRYDAIEEIVYPDQAMLYSSIKDPTRTSPLSVTACNLQVMPKTEQDGGGCAGKWTLCSEQPGQTLATPLIHEGFECDNCQGAIIGFRYRCVECADYDLCHKCEVNQCHSEHFVLRIPRPNTDKKSQHLNNKLKAELLQRKPEQGLSSDNDDEPIQKYKLKKQYGGIFTNESNNIDLDKNIKVMLQLHVNMALKKFKENSKGVHKQYR